MGTEPDATPASDLATLQGRLETETVTFVDTVNDELAALIEDADHPGFDYLVGDIVGPFELCFELGGTLGQVFALGHQYQPVSQLSWTIRVYLWVGAFDCSLLSHPDDTERSVTPHHWFSNSAVHRHRKYRECRSAASVCVPPANHGIGPAVSPTPETRRSATS